MLSDWIAATQGTPLLGLCGIEFYVCNMLSTLQAPENRKCSHMILIAKNTQGYKQLVKMVSRSFNNNHYYYNCRLSLEEIAEYLDGNIIGVTGHMGSTVGDILIEEGIEIFVDKNDKEKKRKTGIWHVKENALDDGKNHIEYLMKIFGPENLGIEIQTYEGDKSGFKELIELNRELCKATGAMPVATADAHYAYQHQVELQRILLGMQGGTDLNIFYESDKLYIPSGQELLDWGNTPEELENTLTITKDCEPLDIFSPPKIPVVDLPKQFNSSSDYLLHLCRLGYKKRFKNNTKEYAQTIGHRVKRELEVIERCGLVNYFLLIYRIINWCRSEGILTTTRGSGAGSMVNYLLELTTNDPIEYGLLFERFFNEGRVVVKEDGTKIYNLPDIDIDVQASQRQRIIRWLREEFGQDDVGQVVTFSTLKGRAALTGACKALNKDITEAEISRITALMPEEHIVDDDLRALAEDFGYRSMIQYCLLSLPETFAPFATLNEDGSISGPLAKEFTIARTLEGVPKGIGTHAGAVVVNIGDEPLADIMPFTKSGDNDKVIGVNMHSIERYGCVKLDLLGSATLDAIATMTRYVNTNGVYAIYEKP
jgi:DNA polymerase-3 subunit alpha